MEEKKPSFIMIDGKKVPITYHKPYESGLSGRRPDEEDEDIAASESVDQDEINNFLNNGTTDDADVEDLLNNNIEKILPESQIFEKMFDSY